MILKLGTTDSFPVGGKAHGLTELIKLGLNVPQGIVVFDTGGGPWKEKLNEMLEEMGPLPKAVRSSALEEDGDSTSFAGLFETFLNCNGKDEITEAVEKCMLSGNLERVASYSDHFHQSQERTIPVIIQDMVNAKKSGVLFTANPVNNRRDQWIINVAEGPGENLVSGKTSGEQYILSRKGKLIQKGSLLNDNEITLLRNQGQVIHDHFNQPVDLEWAIDESGKLYWLQARPVTTLSDVHLNELDGEPAVENEIFTRGNIGEMMPGPVTPLTYSVFGRAIEIGLQDFYISCGAQKDFTNEWLYFRMFYNHLFFSMSNMYSITENVLLNKKENVEFSIMGETLDNDKAFPLAPLWKRVINQIRQFRYLSSGIKRMQKLEEIDRNFRITYPNEFTEFYRVLTESLTILNDSYAHHYCTSSQSGSYNSALMRILSKKSSKPTTENHRDASLLLVDIKGIEGANMVMALEKLTGRFRNDEQFKKWLLELDDNHFLSFIKGKILPQGEIQHQFLTALEIFLEAHGHRCIREGELREKSWSEDPEQILHIIQKQLAASGKTNSNNHSFEKNKNEVFKKLSGMQKMALKFVLPRARAAVARREYTKSLCIRIQQRIKAGYLQLATMMVNEGLLDDTDQIFFLTHDELGAYLKTKDKSWKVKARQRRKIFPEAWKLSFPDVCYGTPEPVDEAVDPVKINGNSVSGLPVSTGIVQGTIRVVASQQEAKKLQPGDIMVCQYTDVGWTPWFSIIAGLVTEIGSPLSHGAVVAREYGIPAIVNAKGSMRFFKDGDMAELDGKNGYVKKISF